LGSQGFQGVPRRELVPQPPIANSTVCVLPSTIMPCAISLCASVAVRVARRCAQASVPPVTTLPSSSTRSFSAIGTPCSGPHRVAGMDRRFGGARRGAGLLGVHLDVGVQLAVLCRDACQVGLGELHRRELASLQLPRELVHRQEGGDLVRPWVRFPCSRQFTAAALENKTRYLRPA
jgi:hypothetical protein